MQYLVAEVAKVVDAIGSVKWSSRTSAPQKLEECCVLRRSNPRLTCGFVSFARFFRSFIAFVGNGSFVGFRRIIVDPVQVLD